LASITLFFQLCQYGKYKAMETQAKTNDSFIIKRCHPEDHTGCQCGLVRQKNDIQTEMTNLKGLLTATQENNALLRKQLTNLSAISSTQAESIKRSLDNIGAKDIYIQQLRAAISHRDSANLAIVLRLKAALGGYGEDAAIKIEKGTVYVDLSEKYFSTVTAIVIP